jgi:hypothetical protein
MRIDLGMYVRAIPLLVRRPSIFVMPLLAAVVDLLLSQISYLFTDPTGGAGAGIFQLLSQLVYLWAFGVTIIQANNIWRRHRGTFEEAWEEGRVKFGGIALAAIGFQFVVSALSYIGSFLNPFLGLALGAIAALFLIYTIPAAAIGGMPGTFAISASIRSVRANPVASVVLAFVFFVLWYIMPNFLQYPLANAHLTPVLWSLCTAAARAIVLAYLAFPFAKQYDDIAFTRLW